MSIMFRVIRLIIVASLFSAMGAQWVALQGIAWANMALARRGDGLVNAVMSATNGRKPCHLCLTAQKGSADAQKKQVDRLGSMRLDLCQAGRASSFVVDMRLFWTIDLPDAQEKSMTLPVELPPPAPPQ
jgi:hypothetical protein